MKQCPMCKTTFEDSRLFCPECGARLVDILKQAEEKKKENVTKTTTQETKEVQKNVTEQKVIIKETGKAAKVILSVLLVIAIGMVLIFYYELRNYEDKYYDEWSENIELSNELDRTKAKLEKYSDLEGVYGYSSENFYAEKAVFVLKKNMVISTKIKANISSGVTYYFRTSSSYVDAEWGDWA